VKLLNAKVKNFMPYKGDQEIVFPTDEQHSVMLVFGDNMRGKTSFLNTIRWCFYEKALGRNLKPIDPINIFNTDAAADGDWNVAVHLRFDHEGHEYELRREMQPKHMIYQPKKSSDLKTDVMLRKDGNVIQGDQIQHEINQIIPEDISRFFLFDGELLQEYEMLLDDKDEQGRIIKESIEKVLGVPALINARDQIDTLLREARKKQTKDSEHFDSVRKYSEERKVLESQRESLDTDLAALLEQQDTVIGQKDVLDREIEDAQSILVGKDKLDVAKRELKQLDSRQENLEQEKLSLLKDAWKDLIQPLLHSHISLLEVKRDGFDSEQRERFKIESRISDLKSIVENSQCPTCEQDIADAKRTNIASELGGLQADLEKFQDDITARTSIIERISRLSRIKTSSASDKIPRIDSEVREISLRMTEIDNEMEELERQLKSHDTAEIARKRSLRDGYVKQLGSLENNIKDRRSAIEENERKQEQLTRYIELNADVREQKSSKLVHAYTELKKVFSESINALRDNLRESVEKLATESFSQLTTEPTYKGLRINENYGLTIVDREDREVAQRSAGAEQIVALSLIDGLNRTARKTGPIIMDTPLGRLDLKHRKKVLEYIPNMAEQVILLVHEGEIRKDEIVDSLKMRIGGMYNIERVSSSESKLNKE